MYRITTKDVLEYFKLTYHDTPVALFSFCRGRNKCNYVAVFTMPSPIADGFVAARTHMYLRTSCPDYCKKFEDMIFPYFDECYREIYRVLQYSHSVKRIF